MRRSFGVLVAVSVAWLGCGPDPVADTQETALLDVRVNPDKELLITDVSVVEDPVRTVYRPGIRAGAQGAWSFGRLIENMSGSRSPSAFVLELLTKWERDQVVNGFVAPGRPAIRTTIIDPWLVASGCAAGAAVCNLDFEKAPFRLTAIVNRIDKRAMPDLLGRVADAGEGRFVFNALGPTGNPLSFTVIFEFALPARLSLETLLWASSWHFLGKLPFGPTYNAQLQLLTDRFSGRNAIPSRPNGSALNALRFNEVSLAPAGSDPTNLPSTKLWEIRSFAIGSNGWLAQNPVAQTPTLALNGTPDLAAWVNANERAILDGTHEVPRKWLDAASPTPSALAWTAPGVRNPLALSEFALDTCSGCHRSETATEFLHLGKRLPGQTVDVSEWMKATDIPRRVADLEKILSVPDLLSAGLTVRIRVGRGH